MRIPAKWITKKTRLRAGRMLNTQIQYVKLRCTSLLLTQKRDENDDLNLTLPVVRLSFVATKVSLGRTLMTITYFAGKSATYRRACHTKASSDN